MPELLCRGDSINFSHQIQSEYYGGNWCVSIEGILLEPFSDSNQASSSLASETVSNQKVFHYFLSDYNKQYAATTAVHSKNITELS